LPGIAAEPHIDAAECSDLGARAYLLDELLTWLDQQALFLLVTKHLGIEKLQQTVSDNHARSGG
jgi:hypothetical protein